ncbi:phosphatase PAP2 family protein [Corynebacterium uropygiale]|uniref:Phosphatase PAP2 family protein n=1 Tax=Corynebacterium uropygiale TaxID=1775911 RepID=A0A9X1QS48_9CORY|nr:phosphatase PAP2 family protein [Corynebacterium uropygiale]
MVVVALVVLTWTEQSLSERLADQGSVYGTIFQTFGQFPPALVSCSGLLMISVAVWRLVGEGGGLHKVALSLFSILLGLAAFLRALAWTTKATNYIRSWRANAAAGLPIGKPGEKEGAEDWALFAPRFFVALAIFVVLLIIVRVVVARASREQLTSIIVAGLVAVSVLWAAEGLVDGMKDAWGRFRPYEVADGKGAFTTWLQINFPNGHKSFPSGHTKSGTMLAGLAILFLPFSKKAARIALWVGAIYGVLMGLSRVLVAAHYPTDTVASFGMTFGLIAAAYVLMQRLLPYLGGGARATTRPAE